MFVPSQLDSFHTNYGKEKRDRNLNVIKTILIALVIIGLSIVFLPIWLSVIISIITTLVSSFILLMILS